MNQRKRIDIVETEQVKIVHENSDKRTFHGIKKNIRKTEYSLKNIDHEKSEPPRAQLVAANQRRNACWDEHNVMYNVMAMSIVIDRR